MLIDLLENIEEVFFEVNNDQDSKDLVIHLITQEQLFEKGEDGDGESLGNYSPYTIDIKTAKGQPADRVTLKDSGQFYESFEIVVRMDEIVIIADTIKEDTDLINEFGQAILKPSTDSLKTYKEYVLPRIIQLLRKEFGAIGGLA